MSASLDGTVRLWQGILWSDLAGLHRQVCDLVSGELTRAEWAKLVPGLKYRPACS